jgi:hypothetical protein
MHITNIASRAWSIHECSCKCLMMVVWLKHVVQRQIRIFCVRRHPGKPGLICRTRRWRLWAQSKRRGALIRVRHYHGGDAELQVAVALRQPCISQEYITSTFSVAQETSRSRRAAEFIWGSLRITQGSKPDVTEATVNTFNATLLLHVLSVIGRRPFIMTCFGSASNHLQEIYVGFPRTWLHLQRIRCFGSDRCSIIYDNLSHLFLVMEMLSTKLRPSTVLNITRMNWITNVKILLR